MKASVVMITYNQENFIGQAIEGIFMQKCNFDYELIIANDCSADKTDEVIQIILKNHPKASCIKYIKHESNIGMMTNFIFALQQSKGKYIALCEGDDCWTDPNKLQKQVDFLESNPDYSICFHDINEIDIDGNEINYKTIESEQIEKEYDILDLAEKNFIHTPSVVFRRNFDSLPVWLNFSPVGDYPLHMLNAQYGKIKYFPQKMASYRVGSGIWTKQKQTRRIISFIQTLDLLIYHFENNKAVQINLKKQKDQLLNLIRTSHYSDLIDVSYIDLIKIFLLKLKNMLTLR